MHAYIYTHACTIHEITFNTDIIHLCITYLLYCYIIIVVTIIFFIIVSSTACPANCDECDPFNSNKNKGKCTKCKSGYVLKDGDEWEECIRKYFWHMFLALDSYTIYHNITLESNNCHK